MQVSCKFHARHMQVFNQFHTIFMQVSYNTHMHAYASVLHLMEESAHAHSEKGRSAVLVCMVSPLLLQVTADRLDRGQLETISQPFFHFYSLVSLIAAPFVVSFLVSRCRFLDVFNCSISD